MKWLKIIFGLLLFLSGLFQFAKVVLIYTSQPFDNWPIGSELGTMAVVITGFALLKSGLKKAKVDASPN